MQPSFLCIGFQKCGTTTMYDILRQHKDIVLARDVKEPMYYRVNGFRALGGKEWYEKRYFSHVPPEDPRLRGEINAGLAFTGCAAKIGVDFPADTKLIFMMRNPVDRCYSAYKYFAPQGFMPAMDIKYDLEHTHAEAFDHFVRRVLSSAKKRDEIMKKRLKNLCFAQGNYCECIHEYMRFFPKENMKFILFEEFIRNQEETCRDLYRFLGIEDDPEVQYNLRSNEGTLRAKSVSFTRYSLIETGVHNLLHEFADLPRRMPAADRLVEKAHRKIQDACIAEETDFSKMLPETRRILENYYRKQVRGVEKLMGRDLGEIWFR